MANIPVVDDDDDANAALALLLRRSGYGVHAGANGREALAAIVKALPDLVVLDLRMPVMNGLELLTIVRAYERIAPAPVIMFTGNIDAESEERAGQLAPPTCS